MYGRYGRRCVASAFERMPVARIVGKFLAAQVFGQLDNARSGTPVMRNRVSSNSGPSTPLNGNVVAEATARFAKYRSKPAAASLEKCGRVACTIAIDGRTVGGHASTKHRDGPRKEALCKLSVSCRETIAIFRNRRHPRKSILNRGPISRGFSIGSACCSIVGTRPSQNCANW